MSRRKRVLLGTGVILVLAGLGVVAVRQLTASNYRVTAETLARAEFGMTVMQVEELFGGPAQEL